MRLAVGGAGVHIAIEGQGPAVLFLHGNPDTHELWDGVIGRMKAQCRCLAPDLPGFGLSGEPIGFDCSLRGLAGWVDGLVEALGVTEPLDLVVHDFGGLFGLAWAVSHPGKVRRIGIMNTMFFPDYRWHFWARVWRRRWLGELSFALNTKRGMVMEMRRGSKGLPAAYAERAYDLISPAMRRMVLRLYRALDPDLLHGWQDGLRSLMARTPACVLWGDLDPYIDKQFAERFGASEVWHFPDAGHWLPVERSEAVAERLLAFLK
jgi:pimeloyl-ACP methyl ester carboxylesterase